MSKRRRRHRKPQLTEEEKLALKKKRRIRRVIVYGTLIVLLWGGWLWQPWELDLVARTPKGPNPRVDPDSKKLFAPGTRVMIITAHPDDSEFYVGGTLTILAKTANIHQIICTDGDKAYYGPFTNAEENRTTRHSEATQANRKWNGKALTFLGHRDGRLRFNDDLVREIVTEIRTFKPEYILAFDGNYPPRFSHQDHRRAGDAAFAAAEECGVPLWLLQFSTNAPNYFVDITDVWDSKASLLAIHKSQFNGDRLARVTNMVAGMAENDGEKSGTTLAEGFRATRFDRVATP